MFNIKKIAATGLMALVIGGGLIGGSMQAAPVSADGDGMLSASSTINVEGSGVPGLSSTINVSGSGVPGIVVEGSGVPGEPVKYDGIRCEDDECLRFDDAKTYDEYSWFFMRTW